MPTARNTFGSTIPQPPSSIHPVCEHTRQPSPPQKMQLTASSADGSVYGKKSERKRVRIDSSSNSARDERLDGAEEIGERDAAVDGERLDLVEHRRVPRVERLVAVRAAGRDHVDRRLLRLHRADLHRRRVRAQQHLLGLAELARRACPASSGPGAPAGCSAPRSCASRPRPRDPRPRGSRARRRCPRARAGTCVTRCRWPRARPWPPSVRSSASRRAVGRRRGRELGPPRLGQRRRSRRGRRRRPCRPPAGRSGSSDLIASFTSAAGEPLAREARARASSSSSSGRRRGRSRSRASASAASSRALASSSVIAGRSRTRAAAPPRSSSTVVAIATFSDSAGRRHRDGDRDRRAGASSSAASPWASLPTHERDGAGEVDGVAAASPPCASAPSRRRPAAPSASSATADHARPPPSPGRRRPRRPRPARPWGCTRRPIRRRARPPPRPDASALRRIVPRLPGSATPDRRRAPARRASSAATVDGAGIGATASTGCGVRVEPDLLEHALLQLGHRDAGGREPRRRAARTRGRRPVPR